MDDQQTLSHPFDSAFKTLVAVCPQLLIPVVNELFGTTFTDSDEVVLMDSKQMAPVPKGKIATREVDSLFAIGGDSKMLFHVECQSTPDNTMVARFWAYDSHIALMNAELSDSGVMEVDFPRSAVLYLRHNRNTPDALKVRLKRRTGEPIDLYEIPVVKTQEYALDELLQKELLFLVPFHAFTHEKKLPEYDADEKKLALLLGELAMIKQKLSDEIDAGRIDALMQLAIQTAILSVLRGLGGELVNVMKGVEQTMRGTILDFEALRIHDKAWEEGEASGKLEGRSEGRSEGRLEMLFTLVGKGRLTELEASEEIRMPVADFRQRMAEYDRTHA